MKTKVKAPAPVTDTLPTEAPPEAAPLSPREALIAKAREDCAFVRETKHKQQEATRMARIELFRDPLERLMATARQLLPLAEAYWRDAAAFVAAARELPRSPSLDMRIGRADISNTLRQYAVGLKRAEVFLAGKFMGPDLGYEVAEITGLLTLAPFIPEYHERALTELCEATAEVKATVARQADRPVGPTVQLPEPTHVGMIADTPPRGWDPLEDFRKEN